MSLSPADDRVEQLIILTERLTDLIARQATAFEARRPHEAARHVEETAKLANIYRHESARVRANVAIVQAAAPERRMRLVRATEAFDAVLARQSRAIAAAKTVTEGLVRAVANEIAAQRPQAAGYGPSAQGAAYRNSATAITLNQRA
ncbi:flagellar basal body protein [Caulobacter hibisci]|uniref:Flagellar basal body protein n=1 Tax=Caulobacter hibisci TaxID=2035993 RepID=A0ABS0SRL0_9CAUL|nr:flagellar basal body protein [Caulobacter hibisci]MBI1682121.1 flagellar basal body protein [Caulobacter hibisci]